MAAFVIHHRFTGPAASAAAAALQGLHNAVFHMVRMKPNIEIFPPAVEKLVPRLTAYVTRDLSPDDVGRTLHVISHQACKNLNDGDYQRLAAAHCVAKPTDSFCSCYNIMNDVCKSNSSAAGCAEKRNKFDKLVAGTPDGQKQRWSGLEKCFGGVCSGAGKYLPPGNDLRCNSSVNVCVQNIEVGSLNDSGMNIVCDIDSSTGSGVSEGGGGGGDAPTVSVSDFKTNPGSYIPKSLDGLMNDTRQKTGGAIGGTVLLSFASAFLLLILIMSIGGGGRRSLRR